MARGKSFDPYGHKFVHNDGPHISERHPRPTTGPSPHGGHDQLGKHDEIRGPQHPENFRDLSPRHPGDQSNRYENDVDKRSWLQSGNATDKPFFDHSDSAPRFNSQDGNVWRKQPSDPGKQDGERYHGGLRHQARNRPKG